MFASAETQKAYELSYATFRVAALVRKPDLKERLERQAATILERVANGDLGIGQSIETLRALLMLSEGIGEIRYINAKVLLRELENLEHLVRDRLTKGEGAEEFDIERMFSATAMGKEGMEDTIRSIQERRVTGAEEATQRAPKVDSARPAGNSANRENRQNGNDSAKLATNGSLDGEARATAIQARIERGNASIKDLIAEFGTVSERTLRYDLQRLVEQGKIERVGSGGPGTYYRLPASESNLLAGPRA